MATAVFRRRPEAAEIHVAVRAAREAGGPCSDEDSPSREHSRRCFRQFSYREVPGPRQALSRLRELCRRWLQPETHSKEQMLELLVLEQFVSILPRELQARVQRRRPKSGDEALAVLEDLEREVEEPGEQPPARACEQEEAVQERVTRAAGRKLSRGRLGTTREPQWNPGQLRPAQESDDGTETWDVELAVKRKLCKEMEPPVEGSRKPNDHIVQMPAGGDICSPEGRAGRQRGSSAERPFLCGECGKSFTQNSILIEHHRTHTGEKPYGCEECGRAFGQRSGLFQHQRLHTGERRYQCRVCGKAFSQNAGLFHHLRVHTGERPYQCSQCSKSFSRRSVLIKHQRIHTGERPYVCEACGKNFIYHCNLVQHRKVHAVTDAC